MKKTIVCFGDSNTHGYDPSTGGRYPDHIRYPGALQEYLGSDYLIREEGMSGRTTVFDDPLFEGLSGLDYLYPCLMSHEPVDLLIIMLGTNDTKERFNVNAENIAKGMTRLVQKALASKEAFRDSLPKVLIVAPAPIESGFEATAVVNEMGLGCLEKSQQLSVTFAEAAKLLGCHFLDAGSIPGIHMHPNDYMHLDEESHGLLAKALQEKIISIL